MPKPNVFLNELTGLYYYQEGDNPEINVTPVEGSTGHPSTWTFVDQQGKKYTPRKKETTNPLRGVRSSFNGYDIFTPVHKGFELFGKGFNHITDATGTTQLAATVMPWLMPSQYVGWVRTGNLPGTKGNTGFGDSKEDQYLNEMFDLGVAPAMIKGTKALKNGVLEGIARYSSGYPQNWARARIISREMNNSFKNNGDFMASLLYPNIIKDVGKGFKYPSEALVVKDINFNSIYSPGKWFSEFEKIKLPDGRIAFRESSPYLVQKNSLNPASLNTIQNLFNTTKTRFLEYYKSPEFKQRALKAGFTEEEIPKLLNEIEERINNTSFSSNLPKGKMLGQNATYHYPNTMRPTTHTILINPYATLEDMTQTMWHEFQHSIGGNNRGENAMRYPMLDKLRKYNDSLLPTERNTLYRDLILNPDKVTSFINRTKKYRLFRFTDVK